jgi:CheY-like chemotaxis protein
METQSPHVLLVDDDEINQLVATKFLKKWKVRVTVAKEGRAALELIKTRGFQLILMDLHMPGMDGQECTRQIRTMSDPYFKNIPIILFSASGAIDSMQSASELGMTDFITKPFLQEELKEKISAYIPVGEDALRPLHIDFDAHTGGDPAFKLELLHLLIENIEELRRSFDLPLTSEDAHGFIKISHKVNSAFIILNDQELLGNFQQLRDMVGKKDPAASTTKKAISEIVRVGRELVRSMQNEIRILGRNNSAQTKP